MKAAGANMTVAEARRRIESLLEGAGIDSAGAESWLMLAALLGLSRTELLAQPSRQLGDDEETMLRDWLERRARREPLQHILGVAPFYGLELVVTPGVLVPRPETERLVELGLASLWGQPAPKVLDVGTGSGAIALALKQERPDAEVWATDISPAALEVAERNAARLSLDVRLVHADLLADEDVAEFARRADLVVSNPPYLPTSDRPNLSPEVNADPPGALFSGAEGLEHFRRLERQAFALLKPDAVLLLELDPRNVQAAWSQGERWREREVLADLVGRERFLRLKR